MPKCKDCRWYGQGKCYSDFEDVYFVHGNNPACDDYIPRVKDECRYCVWCTYKNGTFRCNPTTTVNFSQCSFRPARYDAFYDARFTVPREERKY